MPVMVHCKNSNSRHIQSEFENRKLQQAFQFQHRIVSDHNFLFTVALLIQPSQFSAYGRFQLMNYKLNEPFL